MKSTHERNAAQRAALQWSTVQDNLTSAGELVLLALAWAVDEDGRTCRVSMRWLMAETGRSEKTVRQGLRAIESAGLIRTEAQYDPEDGARLANRYTLAR
jgi:hypothetical protein